MSKTKIVQLKSYVREYWNAYNVCQTAARWKTVASFIAKYPFTGHCRINKNKIGVHEWINLMLRQLNSSAKFGHMKFDYQTAFLFHYNFDCRDPSWAFSFCLVVANDVIWPVSMSTKYWHNGCYQARFFLRQ